MKIALVTAALSAVLVATPASAQVYLGGGIGSAKTDTREDSWKLFGGYQFNRTWGLELGYTDLGRYRGADIETWSLAGTGTQPLGERWSVFGKLGAAANRPHFSGSSRRTDLLVGVGVGYTFTKNIGLNLEYEDYGKLSKSDNGTNARGNNLGLNLKYAY